MLNGIKDAALDFFFPSHCFYCERAVSGGGVICNECFSKIERLPNKVCLYCGLKSGECDCDRYAYHFNGICAPFYNMGIAQAGVYRIKFTGDIVITKFYSHQMALCVKNRFGDINFSAVCFVPAGLKSRLKRKYDQSLILANGVAKELDLPVKKLLKRKSFSLVQHRQNFLLRFENAYGAYYSKEKVSGNILLIDDIKTTGASLDACARALLYAGADSVYCATAVISDKKKVEK